MLKRQAVQLLLPLHAPVFPCGSNAALGFMLRLNRHRQACKQQRKGFAYRTFIVCLHSLCFAYSDAAVGFTCHLLAAFELCCIVYLLSELNEPNEYVGNPRK